MIYISCNKAITSVEPDQHLPPPDLLQLLVLPHVIQCPLHQSPAELGSLDVVDQLQCAHLVTNAHLLTHQLLDLLYVLGHFISQVITQLTAPLNSLHRRNLEQIVRLLHFL